MLEIIINALGVASPFVALAAYHLGRAHGIENTLRLFHDDSVIDFVRDLRASIHGG